MYPHSENSAWGIAALLIERLLLMTINVVATPASSIRIVPSVNQSNVSDSTRCWPYPAVDSEQLLRQCIGNISFATSLLSAFEQSFESRRAKFVEALMDERNDVISDEAHALKGVAGILAASNLVDLCTELHSAVEVADRNHIQNLTESVLHEMQRVIDCIPRIRLLGSSKF